MSEVPIYETSTIARLSVGVDEEAAESTHTRLDTTEAPSVKRGPSLALIV